MTTRDNRDYIRVLLYSYYTTITGWGVLLRHGMINWVAVKELNLGYYIGETILIPIYTHYGNNLF